MIKDEEMFDKYMTIWKKVSNIMKKIKLKKDLTKKKAFNVFCIAVILFDSVYRKVGNYYLKVFLEKLETRKFHFTKYKKHFRSVFFFIFRAWKFSPEI